MSTAIAILTYNRLHCLKESLSGILEHCGECEVAVFDDASIDATPEFLESEEPHLRLKPHYNSLFESQEVPLARYTAFLGTRNLGVAGNSNRAIQWLMGTGADHFLLCNDDLIISGNFAEEYRKAHQDLDIGLFCFNDFTDPAHESPVIPYRSTKLRIVPMMTGIMMSMTRELVNTIGYFDTRFPKFGEEHSDYNNRAYLSGLIKIDSVPVRCVDIVSTNLRHQDVMSSISAAEKGVYDIRASEEMQRATIRYRRESHYRPFKLSSSGYAGGQGSIGLKVDNLYGYEDVSGYAGISD